MTTALSDIPPVDGWTVDDVHALPEDGIRRELLDGVLHVSPSPSSVHQVIAGLLMAELTRTCPEHLFVSQANDVQLSERRLFIPDVLVTTFEAARRPGGSFLANELMLAVEIVSPSSQSMDRLLKPSLYGKAGIPGYWRIEIDNGEILVHAYQIGDTDGVYQPVGTFTDVIKVDEPWRIEMPITGLRPRNL